VGRELGEVLGVLLNSLVGILADLAGVRQTKGAQRRQPLGQKILDQALAQNQLRFLVEPHLCDVEHEQDSGKLGEDNQLLNEFGEILVRQRVVERLIPSVEPDLRVSGRAYDRN